MPERACKLERSNPDAPPAVPGLERLFAPSKDRCFWSFGFLLGDGTAGAGAITNNSGRLLQTPPETLEASSHGDASSRHMKHSISSSCCKQYIDQLLKRYTSIKTS
jgi:hypothetical protein